MTELLSKTLASPDADPKQDWSEGSRAILARLKAHGASGRVTAEDAAALIKAENATVERVMVRLLPIARDYARPPISNFHVGAVGLGASGALYLGANFEVGGNALNQTIHGEQSVVANAFSHQERGLTALAVTDAPCGHCRQFLNELTGGLKLQIIVPDQKSRTLEDLLPSSFGPQDLGVTGGLLNSPPAELHLTSRAKDALAQDALVAASRAYAPYTKAHSGCAVLFKSGRSYNGAYLENAAFNPSLSPLQSALVRAVFAGEDLSTIERVVLVELKGAVISQRSATEAVLASLAAKASLETRTAAVS